MTGGRRLVLLTPEDIRRELTRINLEAAAIHHPDQRGLCPECGVRACDRWIGAVRALRAAGVLVSALRVCPPQRPAWHCELHDEPWPCGPARCALGDAHGYDAAGRAALAAHMAGLLVDAAREVGAPAGELVERFVAWTLWYRS